MFEYIEKPEMLNLDVNIRKKAPILISDLSDGLMLKVKISLFKWSRTRNLLTKVNTFQLQYNSSCGQLDLTITKISIIIS